MTYKINVIGLGFVGLTTAIALASKKFEVYGVENHLKKLNLLKKNIIPFFEPLLKEKLIEAKKSSKLFLNDKILLSKKKINVIFICIGTPAYKNGDTNLTYIINFLKKIKKNIGNEKVLFVIKSTVPPLSSQKFKKIFKNNKNINFCSNPEFLREGSAWYDFFNSGKIVIGCEDLNSKRIMNNIYKGFDDEKIFVNQTTAEFIKYLSNSLLANMISFSNDLAILAEKLGNIDIKKSFYSIKKDARWIGSPANMCSYFHPGLGYGGYCLPKDIKSFKNLANKFSKNSMLNSIDAVNNKILNHQYKKILKIKNKNIFFLGLSFKPESDDLRSSKPIELIKKILKLKKYNIYASDPKSYREAKQIFLDNKITILEKPHKIKNTTYILTTAWKENINFLKKIPSKNYIDLRYTV